MNLLLLALALLLGGALLPLLLVRSPKAATASGVALAVAGSLVGLSSAVQGLRAGEAQSFLLPWSLPLGALRLGLDPLSAFFLLPLFLLGGLCALYGRGYLGVRPRDGASWSFYNLLLGAMAVVFTARDAVLFVMAWELMAVTSFALVVHERERDNVRHAGWIYLAASHLGLAALLAVFFGLSHAAGGSLDFARFRDVIPSEGALGGLLFLLAVLGFGAKAGFLTLHGWLPEAHPAAPSHVSALMSGVLIKTGLYGLLRVLTFFSVWPAWWGGALLVIGLAGCLFGILQALTQQDLKRSLAFSSVENIGIIALGLGLGMLGAAWRQPVVAALGFAGALLHVLNHALFKGLLFLGAGSVLHGAGTLRLDQLGGLLKTMPQTGALFLFAAAAICGLPPLNGFASEFLIYLGAFHGACTAGGWTGATGLIVIGGLALTGGLTLACFARLTGLTFLGERRAETPPHESSLWMRLPMGVLALCCALAGLGAPWFVPWLFPRLLAGTFPALKSVELAPLAGAALGLRWVVILAAAFALLVLALALLRRARVRAGGLAAAGTWDCGYAQPNARMQYTASSFAGPLARLFQPFLRARSEGAAPQGLFPAPVTLSTKLRDVATDYVAVPLFRAIAWLAQQVRWLQHGRVQLYVLYIAVTLLALLLWKL
jgi:formate hydrogenlyase subunit 3/multisubunit Na+/H+ antiporter MnhD subunit